MKRKYAIMGLFAAITMLSSIAMIYAGTTPEYPSLEIRRDGGISIWTVETSEYSTYTYVITSMEFVVEYYEKDPSCYYTTIYVDAEDALIEEVVIGDDIVLTFKLAILRQLLHESKGEVDDPYDHYDVIDTYVHGKYYEGENLIGDFTATGPAWRPSRRR